MKSNIVAWILNILCIAFLFWKIAKIGNDKAPVLFLSYYPVLVFLNLSAWFALWIFGNGNYKAYRQTGIALLLLAIPLFFISGRL